MNALRQLKPFVRYIRTITIRNDDFPNYIIPYDCRLFYVTGNTGRLYFESENCELVPGTVVMWSSGMKYHMEPIDCEQIEMIAVNFDLTDEHCDSAFPIPPSLEENFDERFIYETPVCDELPMKKAPIILNDAYFCEQPLREMLEDYEQQRVMTDEYLSTRMQQILVLIARRLVQSESDARIGQVLSYIYAHYHEALTNETLGERFGFHPNSLNRLMVRHTGTSLHQYLLMYRLRQAILMIESGNEPIALIAEKVGIVDPGYFSKLFRKKIGRKPLDYRKK